MRDTIKTILAGVTGSLVTLLLVGGVEGRAAFAQGQLPTVDTNSGLAPGEGRVLFENSDPNKSYEWGFYQYGPALLTNWSIVELWIGDQFTGGSSLSVKSVDGSRGGRFEARNAPDTDGLFLDYYGDIPRIHTDYNPDAFGSPKPIGIDPSNGKIYLGFSNNVGVAKGLIETPILGANVVNFGINQDNSDPVTGQTWLQFDVSEGQRITRMFARPAGDTGTAKIVAEFDGANNVTKVRVGGELITILVAEPNSCGAGRRCLYTTNGF